MAIKAINGVTADTTSSAIHVFGADKHTVSVTFTGVSAMVVHLLGSVRNRGDSGTATFQILATYTASAADISAGYCMFHVVNKPVEFVKVQVDGTDSGSGWTTSAWYTGSRGGMRVA